MHFRRPITLMIASQLVLGVPVPRDLVEVVVSPKDVKEAGKYAMVKIPQIKENFKNNVKQKLLDRLMSKSVQAMVPQVDPATGEIVGFNVAPGSDSLQPVSQLPVKIPRKGISSILTNGMPNINPNDESDSEDEEEEDDDDENGVIGYSESIKKHGKGI